MTRAEAKRYARSSDPTVRAEAKRFLEGRRRRAQRTKPKRGLTPGLSREARRTAADELERAGKAAARERAGGRCEWHEGGRRCTAPGTDADHVLGGRWKRDMEALPNGEGFMWLCVLHHRVTKHGPDRRGAHAQAKEHALRIGARGLLRHVEAAIRRHEAKHGRTTP